MLDGNNFKLGSFVRLTAQGERFIRASMTSSGHNHGKQTGRVA
jgi:hypothetical protein